MVVESVTKIKSDQQSLTLFLHLCKPSGTSGVFSAELPAVLHQKSVAV